MSKTSSDEIDNVITREATDVVVDNQILSSLGLVPFWDGTQNPTKIISDIARVVEAFVFYSRVIVFLYPARDIGEQSFTKTRQLLAYQSLCELAESENALYFVTPSDSPENTPHPTEIVKQAIQFGIKLDINTEELAWGRGLEVGYLLYQQELARQSRLPFAPSENYSFIESYMSRSHQARINISRSILSSLDSATKKDVELLQQIGVPIQFYVPPLLSLVLERVVKGANFGESVWEIREQFKPIRNLIAEYGVLTQETSQPLKRIIRERDKIFRDVDLLTKHFEKRDSSTLKEWADVLDTIPSIMKSIGLGIIPKASLIAKLIELPIE